MRCQCADSIHLEVRSALISNQSPLISSTHEKVRGIPGNHRLVAQACLRLSANNNFAQEFSPIPLRLFWRGKAFIPALVEATCAGDWSAFRAGLWELMMFPPSPEIAKRLPVVFSALTRIADRESVAWTQFVSLMRAHWQYVDEDFAIDVWERLEFPPGLLSPRWLKKAALGAERDRVRSIALDVLLSCGMVEEPLSVLSYLQTAGGQSSLARSAAIALGGDIYCRNPHTSWEAFLSGLSASELLPSRDLLQRAINSLAEHPRAVQYIIVHFPHELSHALFTALEKAPDSVSSVGMALAVLGGVRARPWVHQQYQASSSRSLLFKVAKVAMNCYPPNLEDLKLAIARKDLATIVHHASAATPSIADQAPIEALCAILSANGRESIWLRALQREEDIVRIAQFLLEHPHLPHYATLSPRTRKMAQEAFARRCDGELQMLASLVLSLNPRCFIRALSNSPSPNVREKILSLFHVRFGTVYHSPSGCWTV